MVRCTRITWMARNLGVLRTLKHMVNEQSAPSPGVRQVSPLARAAHTVLGQVQLEVSAMEADAAAAERDLRGAGRKADVQRDLAERATRLAGEAAGAKRVLQLLGRLARG